MLVFFLFTFQLFVFYLFTLFVYLLSCAKPSKADKRMKTLKSTVRLLDRPERIFVLNLQFIYNARTKYFSIKIQVPQALLHTNASFSTRCSTSSQAPLLDQ